ncbi:hypothetical protein [Sulfurisphaera ohwakuensis]|uniref:DNA-directed RNA polymerase subunit M n=1 Tax=Sulfurisphaera ohwakuensis TaxID=69656 RepID=A0A650CJ87_SULOH|nr:hypothetical protein [Sulfurisphaera ohwakuensis]MBB5254010.1 DNA-directed RNA polymerase subunit M [Sulfurisphaera ohwakuensis]QGR17890.1 hypothetical protein D1869_12430 [Sulfurisphaera ohwakuensis]
MKKGSRLAVIAKSDKLYAICVFRGKFLEKIFFELEEKAVREKFYNSSIVGEVKDISSDKEKEEYCKSILEKIERKLNKLLIR